MIVDNFMFAVQNNMNNYHYLFRDAVCSEEAKANAIQKDKYIYKWHILTFTVNTTLLSTYSDVLNI